MSKFNFNIDNIDIENNLDNTTLLKSMNNIKSLKKVYEENLNVVDLGLPSGTKWCEYNLGVDIKKLNNSSEPEDWYGGLYAWGENKSKYYFTITGYKWYTKNRYYNGMTKYTYDQGIMHTDNKCTLENEDDAAYQDKTFNIGTYCMPSKYDFNELLNNTSESWVRDYEGIFGLNGMLFAGKNGNKLFFPAAGLFDDNGFNGERNRGYYWTSNLNWKSIGSTDAHNLYFDGYILKMSNERRHEGLSIRPILNDKEKREE